jgi:ABC-2 type transport system permease protein
MVLRQLRFENKAFWRNPASAFFTFAFPLMFFVIFNTLFSSKVEINGHLVNSNYFYVPAIAAFSIITATYTNIAISISFARDEGILKRIRGTPLPPVGYLFSRMLHALFVALILMLIIVGAGTLLYNVDLPTETLPAFLLIVLVGGASFCSLGLALTSVIPNADAAPPIVNFTILPLLFVSGIFIPLDSAPAWLIHVAKIFPVYHYAQALQASFDPFDPHFEGMDLLIVAIWGVAGLLLAMRFFSWEPRR